MLKTAIPVFHVSDSLAAEEFYCRGLGFSLQFCRGIAQAIRAIWA